MLTCNDCNTKIKDFIISIQNDQIEPLCLDCLRKNGTKNQTRVLETEFFPLTQLIKRSK